MKRKMVIVWMKVRRKWRRCVLSTCVTSAVLVVTLFPFVWINRQEQSLSSVVPQLRPIQSEDVSTRGSGGDSNDKYPTAPLRGYHTSIDTPGCSSKTVPCVIRYPFVDLANHLPHDEALLPQSFTQTPPPSPSVIAKLFRQNGNSTDITLHSRHDNNNDDYAVLTRRGYKGIHGNSAINQDNSFLITPFLRYSNEEDSFLMGIFDGHGIGGEIISRHVASTLPTILAQRLQHTILPSTNNNNNNNNDRTQQVVDAIVRSFLQVDATCPTNRLGAGSTASIILRLASNIYIANTGDSSSFLVLYTHSTQTTQLLYLSRQDKPDVPEEFNRIQRMGGQVLFPNPFLMHNNNNDRKPSARVIINIPQTHNNKNNPNGPIPRQMALAMSRAIGEYPGKLVGVIPDPIVDVWSIDPTSIQKHSTTATPSNNNNRNQQQHKQQQQQQYDGKNETIVFDNSRDIGIFAVVASDGIMDQMSPLEVAQQLAIALYSPSSSPFFNNNNDNMTLLQTIEDIIFTCSRKWIQNGLQYRDDITLAVSRIQ